MANTENEEQWIELKEFTHLKGMCFYGKEFDPSLYLDDFYKSLVWTNEDQRTTLITSSDKLLIPPI